MKRLILAGGAVAAILFLIWSIMRPATTDAVVHELAGRSARGDAHWLYDRAMPTEQSLMSKEVLQEFYRTFLAPMLKDAAISQSDVFYRETSHAVLYLEIERKGMSVAQVPVSGYVIDGKPRVSAFHTLMTVYGYLRCPGMQGRELANCTWKDVGPWLLERGVREWYLIDSDAVLPVPGAKSAGQQGGGD